MDNHSLLAVSPVDGRYSRQTEPLREYFSEYALIKYRVRIEIEYFIALCQIPLPQLADFDSSKFEALRDIYRNMTPEDAAKVKEIEKQVRRLPVLDNGKLCGMVSLGDLANTEDGVMDAADALTEITANICQK